MTKYIIFMVEIDPALNQYKAYKIFNSAYVMIGGPYIIDENGQKRRWRRWPAIRTTKSLKIRI